MSHKLTGHFKKEIRLISNLFVFLTLILGVMYVEKKKRKRKKKNEWVKAYLFVNKFFHIYHTVTPLLI